ncbi:MAG: AMP-binding protein [Muribaculaceae bacterium]|nr:AMP-binding protein [Muribaculaceae bacterium]
MQAQDSLNKYIEQAIKSRWEHPAMSNFQGAAFEYRDVARKISKLHILFEKTGLKPGDKIAYCGKNSAQWAIAVIGAITYGAVAVPILHDFKAETVQHLINHCEAKLVFVDNQTWKNMDIKEIPQVKGVLLIDDYSLLMSADSALTEARNKLNLLFGQRYPERFRPEDIHYYEPSPDELALINYTSGSTGMSKGVMLTYGNLWSNIQYYIDRMTFLKPGDSLLSMLPLAHMYGLMVECMHGFVKGVHVYFLARTPSPKIIMDALAEIKPKLVVTVPLVLEKIIRTRVFPALKKPIPSLMLKVPGLSERIYSNIHNKLIKAFGGNLREVIIGGAALSEEVETFLRRIKFPFTVGYGMTECAPLIAYASWDEQRPGSCGKVVSRMKIKVDSPDPANIPGVLWVSGENVMKGYYHNPEATEEAFQDGWMRTGDICNVDKDGFIYIRGRDKNMILGPSGQNIYPEEIEQKLNVLPLVSESIVIDDADSKLIALIHPDMEQVAHRKISDEELQKIMKDNITVLNQQLPAYSKVSDFKIYTEEFEKTPKRSIKRFLYQIKK